MNNKYWLWGRFEKWKRIILFHEKASAEYLIEKRIRNEKQKAIASKVIRDGNFELLSYHTDDQIWFGQRVSIGKDCWIWCHDDEDSGPVNGKGKGFLSVGNDTYIGKRFHADCYAPVTIGNECLIADEVMILTSNHGMNAELEGSYVKQPFETGEVSIEEGCWIGSRVTILPGVKIGKKSVIGTNAVVTKNIPAYSIAVGIPARIVKKWNFELHRWENIEVGQ